MGVWLYPGKKPEVAGAEAEAISYDLEIYHYHVPGNPDSEEMADILNKIGSKYEQYVRVTRVDIAAHPEIAKEQKVTKPPKVVMVAGEVRACKFQGLWTQAQVERKVEEILRGLKRMGPDWRPDVKGMQTATGPGSPAKR